MGPKTVRVRNLEEAEQVLRSGAWDRQSLCDCLTQHTGCIAYPWPGLEVMHLPVSLGHVIERAFAAPLLLAHKTWRLLRWPSRGRHLPPSLMTPPLPSPATFDRRLLKRSKSLWTAMPHWWLARHRISFPTRVHLFKFCDCGDFHHTSTWVCEGLIQNLCWKVPLRWEDGSLGCGVWSADDYCSYPQAVDRRLVPQPSVVWAVFSVMSPLASLPILLLYSMECTPPLLKLCLHDVSRRLLGEGVGFYLLDASLGWVVIFCSTRARWVSAVRRDFRYNLVFP